MGFGHYLSLVWRNEVHCVRSSRHRSVHRTQSDHELVAHAIRSSRGKLRYRCNGAVNRSGSYSRGLSAHFFRVGSGDVRCDLSYHADVLPEHAWRSRTDGGRISGDLGSTGAVPPQGSCSAGCIAFSPLCICRGPVAQCSEVMRWKSLVYPTLLRLTRMTGTEE